MSCTKHRSELIPMAVEFDRTTGMITLNDDWVEAEFRVATRQAVEDNADSFMFHGFRVNTAIAIDVVHAMSQVRQYH